MMNKPLFFTRMTIKKLLIGALLIGLAVYFRSQLLLILQLLFGGWLIAFLLESLCEAFAQHMRRIFAVALSFLSAIGIAALLVLIVVPPLMSQIGELLAALPTIIETLQAQIEGLNVWLLEHNLFTVSLPELSFNQIAENLSKIMTGTVGFASVMVGNVTQFVLIAILAFYFLLDKERFLFKLELLIPYSMRRFVLRIACAVKRELKLYLRGQLMISLIVGTLTAILLFFIGIPSFLVLAIIVGVFNLIPYFGPLLGAIPAVLFALRMGFSTVVKTILALFLVQQIDGLILSPRIMSSLTGFSPPVVLIAITVGGSIGGIGGMFFAMPCLLIGKICARVYTNRNQMIEKETEV